MKEIQLTQGKIAIVDDESYERLNQYKWYAWWSGWVWYAVRNIRINNKVEKIYMHREIMLAPKGIPVDHRNGNGLNNLKENLRLCNNQQNGFNRKNPYSTNKLGIKGVCWDKLRNKFIAQIMFNGKHIHLGRFTVLGDADQSYRKAEEKYFGEFARNS